MNRGAIGFLIGVCMMSFSALSIAGEKDHEQKGQKMAEKKAGSGKEMSSGMDMSQERMIKVALSAAPSEISKDATVLVPGEDGKMVEAKKGTNGFTCIPWIDNPKDPDPICMDPAAHQWLSDAMSKAPKPTNTVPGIAYMARGGIHYEKDGKITMEKMDGAKTVKEPAHWMIFWPFDSKTVGIPSLPNHAGVYIMFEGTPYSHLMIYQDPNKLVKK